MNLIKKEFIFVKNSPFFLDIMSSRINESTIQEYNKDTLLQLEAYMVKI